MSGISYEVEDETAADRPHDELDIYQRLLQPQGEDRFLRSVNVGTGNYSDAEMWQQVQSYRDGLYGEAALSRRIVDRAIHATKRALAIEGIRYWDDNDDEYCEFAGWTDLDATEQRRLDRRRWLDQRAHELWRALPTDVQERAVYEHSGLDQRWTPPHWQMLQMRHEASRSRGARLLDNITGRVREIFGDKSGGSGATDAVTNGHRESKR